MQSKRITKPPEIKDMVTTELEINFWRMSGSSEILKHLEVIRIALLEWEKAQDPVGFVLHSRMSRH